MLRSILSLAFTLGAAAAFAQSPIPAKEAAKHIGEKQTVCDKVYGGRYFENGKDQPTLLNMGDAYPNNPFTFVIYGESRSKFPWKPEEYLVDRNVCVTGEIKDYRGKPQIIVSDTAQLVIKK
ncbi:MAG: DNA-binding protein [Bacteroidetes bacterium]|nr:DNA-binding protein [Bacteroidota bacterium]